MDETSPHEPHHRPKPPGGGGTDRTEELSGISKIFGLDPEPAGFDPLVGNDLGGVTIVRLIAEGGMGRVYEGRQHRPDRAVAVKVMRPGVASAELLRRFEYETQVLGQLTHPGIAQIYTVGTHAFRGAQVPYFVMEYIPQARTVTKYAADLNLSTQERLGLFRKVCDAVAYGHRKGVIHRDLKPGNILVDAAGQPRVIDFGVARSTDADMAITTQHTAVGQLIGTVQYMSPEQFNADPNAIDMRADVYALGVVLYELLAGKPPYDVRRKAIFEAARVVREDEPTPIAALNKTLNRAVGNIALKCLEKDRTRRYATAGELADDIGRYLAGEPVAAGAPSFLDGVSRLVRRHRAAAVASAAVALSVVLAAVAITVFATQASRQRAVATLERERSAALERVADVEKARADAQSIATAQRRYAANVHRLEKLLHEDNGAAAETLLRETRELGSADVPVPIELSCLAASFDGAIATLAKAESRTPWFVISPDSETVAVGGAGRLVRLAEARTGRDAVPSLNVDGATRVAFSDDGSLAALARDDLTIRVLDVATGRESLSLALSAAAPAAALPLSLERLAFGPGGRAVVAVVQDARSGMHLGLWRVADGTLMAASTVKDSPSAFAFSPDGSQLLVSLAPIEHSGCARLIDAATGVVRDIEGWCTTVAFHPAGGRCMVIGGTGSARLLDTATCATIVELPVHTANISWVAFTPDGTKVITASGDTRIHVADAQTGEVLADWEWNPKAVAIAMSPDGGLLAAAALKGGVTVWNLETQSRVADVTPSGCDVCCIAFGPQRGRLALGGRGGMVRIWDTEGNAEVAALRGHTGRIRDMAFAADGKRIVTASTDGSARLWDSTRTMATTIECEESKRIIAVAYSPDGSLLATGSIDGSSNLWDATSLESIAAFPEGGRSIAFTPDGTGFAAASRAAGAPAVTIYDVASRTPRLRLPAAAGPVVMLNFAGTRRDLMTIASGGQMCLWDMQTGRPRVEMKVPPKVLQSTSPEAVASSPDGKWITVGGGDGIVRIWDTVTGAELAKSDAHSKWVVGLRFNADGSRLLSSSIDGTARVWDMVSCNPGTVVPGGGPGVIGWLGADRFAIGTFGGAVLLGDATAAAHPTALQRHTNRIIGIACNRDGMRFGTLSLDHSVRLWDAASGDIVLTLPDRRGLATSLAFSPDQRRLAAIVDDAVVIWGLSNGEMHRARNATAAP